MRSAPPILISPSTQRNGTEFYDYSFSLSEPYTRAVLNAGGIPWILPCSPSPELISESVRRCGGVLLTGGDDVQPRLYREALPQRLSRTVSSADPARDLAEILLVQEIFRQRKPLLAICRGQQLVNVALGGTLIVDIASERPGAIKHDRLDQKAAFVHSVTAAAGSALAAIFGREKFEVNSTHHQAVERVADLFCPTALSPDGIVEALELTAHEKNLLPFFVAVQFHPERLIAREPACLELFRRFTQACSASQR